MPECFVPSDTIAAAVAGLQADTYRRSKELGARSHAPETAARTLSTPRAEGHDKTAIGQAIMETPCGTAAAAKSWISRLFLRSRPTLDCKQHTILTGSADGHSGQDRLTGLAGSCRGVGVRCMPDARGKGGEGGVRRGKQSAGGGAGPCPAQTNRETGHCSDA